MVQAQLKVIQEWRQVVDHRALVTQMYIDTHGTRAGYNQIINLEIPVYPTAVQHDRSNGLCRLPKLHERTDKHLVRNGTGTLHLGDEGKLVLDIEPAWRQCMTRVKMLQPAPPPRNKLLRLGGVAVPREDEVRSE